MTNRFLSYWHTPADPMFVKHIIEGIGLSTRDQEIAWRFRRLSGNTEFFSEKADLPLKLFNAVTAGIARRVMAELIRLAQIGWRAEQDSMRR